MVCVQSELNRVDTGFQLDVHVLPQVMTVTIPSLYDAMLLFKARMRGANYLSIRRAGGPEGHHVPDLTASSLQRLEQKSLSVPFTRAFGHWEQLGEGVLCLYCHIVYI